MVLGDGLVDRVELTGLVDQATRTLAAAVQSLTSIDARLEHAAGRPVIVPETIVCDHGKAYLSAAVRSACRSLGNSLAPAHPDTPTDEPRAAYCTSSGRFVRT